MDYQYAGVIRTSCSDSGEWLESLEPLAGPYARARHTGSRHWTSHKEVNLEKPQRLVVDLEV